MIPGDHRPVDTGDDRLALTEGRETPSDRRDVTAPRITGERSQIGDRDAERSEVVDDQGGPPRDVVSCRLSLVDV